MAVSRRVGFGTLDKVLKVQMFAQLATLAQSPVACASLSGTVVKSLKMDWSNETVLEFIELMHEEPCIWNHKSKDRKNKNVLNEAWVRLSNNFSVPCTVEDLKKKRNSLLTQYRDCLRKIKESTQTDAEIYRPSWFAFDAMNSYLSDLYGYRPKLSGEPVELLIVEDSEQSGSDHGVGSHFANFWESTEEQPLESPLSRESNTERPLSRESTSRKRKNSNADPLSDSFQIFKRQRRVQYSATKKQMEEGFSHISDRSNRRDNDNILLSSLNNEETASAMTESDLYGQLLAHKLKSLEVDDRLILMNDIDNFVFKYLMNIRKRNKLSRSAHLPSMTQRHSDNRQSMDLPGPSSRSNQYNHGIQKNMQNFQPMSINEDPIRILKTETEPR